MKNKNQQTKFKHLAIREDTYSKFVSFGGKTQDEILKEMIKAYEEKNEK